MLEQLHRIVSTQQIRIDPRFKGVISALGTAITKQFGDIYDLQIKSNQVRTRRLKTIATLFSNIIKFAYHKPSTTQPQELTDSGIPYLLLCNLHPNYRFCGKPFPKN